MAKQVQLDRAASFAKSGKKTINLLETDSIEEVFAATKQWQQKGANAIDDPGLCEALQFCEELEAGRSQVFSAEESRLAWERIDDDIANLERSLPERITT